MDLDAEFERDYLLLTSPEPIPPLPELEAPAPVEVGPPAMEELSPVFLPSSPDLSMPYYSPIRLFPAPTPISPTQRIDLTQDNTTTDEE